MDERSVSLKDRVDRINRARAGTRSLVEGALDLLSSEGPTALTTARIASTAGLSQPAFYVYFPTRESCLRLLGETVARVVVARIEPHLERALAVVDERSLRRALGHLEVALFELSTTHRRTATVFSRIRADPWCSIGAAIAAREDEMRRSILSAAASGRPRGDAGPTSVTSIDVGYAGIVGVLETALRGGPERVSEGVEGLRGLFRRRRSSLAETGSADAGLRPLRE